MVENGLLYPQQMLEGIKLTSHGESTSVAETLMKLARHSAEST